MLHVDRLSPAWKTVFAGRSLDDRIRFVPRVAVALVALFFAIALIGQSVASARLTSLQRDEYPALRDARDLAATLTMIHTELDAVSRDRSSLGRADSLAAHLRTVTRSSQAPGMAMVDQRFADYFLRARRAAIGARSSDEAELSTAAEQQTAYRLLAAQLASNAIAAEGHVAATVASATSMQSFVSLTLALCGTIAVLVLALLGVAATVSISASLDDVARIVDGIVGGTLGVRIPDTERGASGRLHAALRRLAKQMRENSSTVHALADGDYRSATRTRQPTDPIGLALAQLSSTMESIASMAQHVSRGDLSVAVIPQSDDDTFGHAQAAMLRRITSALTDMEATRHSIAALTEEVRVEALSLASSTSDDADRLRRTIDRLAVVTLQSRAHSSRGAILSVRAAETDSMLDQGTTAFEQSQSMLREVVRKSAVVQRLARDAAQLAVRATAGAGHGAELLEDARALSEQAGATTSEIIRAVVEGSERAHESGVAIDRVAIALQDGMSLVREVSSASHEQSEALVAIDDAIVQLHGTTSRSAERTRQLVTRLEALASQARRMDALLRRFRRTPSTWGTPALIDEAIPMGPVLYRTPPHAFTSFPRLALASH